MFFICMLFSVGMPLILPFGALFFTIKYFLEKYNLIYVYPAEFDTKVVNRKTLIIYIIGSLLAFQAFMFIIVGFLLSERISVYLFAIIIIQMMIIVTSLEFVRAPWEGKETDVEIILNERNNNIFDSLSDLTEHESQKNGRANSQFDQEAVRIQEDEKSAFSADSDYIEAQKQQRDIKKQKYETLK